jgi:hypothetical protein
MGSNVDRFKSPKLVFLHLICVSSSLPYWYHLVNETSLGLAQSDPIKRLTLYNNVIVNENMNEPK